MLRISGSKIRVLKPGLHAYVRVEPNSVFVSCVCDWHEFEGDVSFLGEVDHPGKVVQIGFSQLLVVQTNRAEYRGRLPSHGSIIERRDIPPALKPGASRDNLVAGSRFGFPIDWEDGSPIGIGNPTVMAGGPNKFTTRYTCRMLMYNDMLPGNIEQVSYSDSPLETFLQWRINTLTNRTCSLHSLLVEQQFVTVLVVLDDKKQFHQLKHLYWNVHWDARFDVVGTAGKETLKPLINGRNTRVVLGPVLDGAPADARFRHLVTAPYAPTANDAISYAANHPVLQHRPTW